MGKRQKVGLALGGGGARGLAHIGVLKALEREGIPIDLIVGTSMGALVGAVYAVNPDAQAIERRVYDFFTHERSQPPGLKRLERVRRFNAEKIDFLHRIVRIAEKHLFLSLAIMKKALVSEDEMKALLEVFLPDIDLAETAIPFAAVAVDLATGKEVVLKEGSLIKAVMASCAVPGFMPHVTWDGMILVDGAVIDAIPADPARDAGVDVVIGVDVGACLGRPCSIEDGIDAINRSMEIMNFYLSRQSGERADLIVEPAVKHIEWNAFLNYEELIREGETAAEAKIEVLRDILKHRFGRKVFQWTRGLIPGLRRECYKRGLPTPVMAWAHPKMASQGIREDKTIFPQNQPVLDQGLLGSQIKEKKREGTM